jgi:hypothetical protein
MPRWGRHDEDDYGYDRAWDNFYNQCNCEWRLEEDEDAPGYTEVCHYCKRQAEAHAAREAARKAKEDSLRATGWYTEITTIQAFINRISWLTGPANFHVRVKVFGELFTTLLGYEKFLATNSKLRAVIAEKMADCRASQIAASQLNDVLDQLETVLARAAAPPVAPVPTSADLPTTQ